MPVKDSKHRFSVAASEIRSILTPSVSQGLDLKGLLNGLDLPAHMLENEKNLVNLEDAWRIMFAHQGLIREETHLISTRPLKHGTTRFVFSNLAQCATLGEGLEALADAYNIVHGGDYNLVRQRGKCISYLVEDSDFHYRSGGNFFAIELALITIHCALTQIVGQRINPVKLCTKRNPLSRRGHHLGIFGCNVHFRHPHYELAYPAEFAGLPLRMREQIDLSVHLLHDYLVLVAEGDVAATAVDPVVAVEGWIHHGSRDQQTVATAMGMSVATLRRKLKARGTSFREILDRVNSEIALMMLTAGDSQDKVAEVLGYCDGRSFKRAFKRWHGCSPAAYANQAKRKSIKPRG